MLMLSHFSHVEIYVTSWTITYQAPLSIGFSWQEYWSGLPYPPPGDLPDPGIKPASPGLLLYQVDSLPLSHKGSPFMHVCIYVHFQLCFIACRSLVPQPEIEHTFSAVKACSPNHVTTRECPEHFQKEKFRITTTSWTRCQDSSLKK